MSTIPLREIARYSLRTQYTNVQSRTSRVWCIYRRFDVLEEAIEAAQSLQRTCLRPVAVFDMHKKVWPLS